MSIVSRAEIIAALGKGSGGLSDQDLGLVNMIQAPVENLVESFVGYKLTLQQYTEYLPPRNLILQVDPLDPQARQSVMAG